MKSGPVRRRDQDAAVTSARVFRQTALAVLERAPEGTGDGSRRASSESLGSVVCAATNLALALELYLKAAHIQARTNFSRRTHYLDGIYLALPDADRRDLAVKYDDLLSQVRDEQIQFIDLARGPVTPPPWEGRIQLRDGLEPMLGRCRDAFVSWRYVFEIELADVSSHQMIRFEHSLMNTACEAIERHLNSS
jgi:hypothetical protein